jgi:hypothetical protein
LKRESRDSEQKIRSPVLPFIILHSPAIFWKKRDRKMVRGPRARAVPKSKVMPEDGETLKAAMKAEKNGKLMNGNGSHQLMPPNPRKRGRNTLSFSL